MEKPKRQFNKEDLYRKAIHARPSSSAFNDLGCLLPRDGEVTLLNGETMSKAQMFKRSIALNPQNSHAWSNLAHDLSIGGFTTLEDGEMVTKTELYKHVIKLKPAQAAAYANLADALPLRGCVTLDDERFTREQLYVKAISLKPDSRYYSSLAKILPKHATVLLSPGHPASVTELLIKALQCGPKERDRGTLYYKLGCAASRDVTIDGCTLSQKELFLRAISADPNNADAYNNLGWMLPSEGGVTLADGSTMTKSALYKRAISLKPSHSLALNNLGWTLAKSGPDATTTLEDGTIATAIELYKRAIFFKPRNASAYANLAWALPPDSSIEITTPLRSDKKDVTKAVMTKSDLFKRAIAYDPQSGFAYSCLACTLEDNGATALESGKMMTQGELLVRAIALKPNHVNSYLKLSMVLCEGEVVTFEDGSLQTKQSLLETARRLDPQNSVVFFELAVLPSRSLPSALRYLRKSIQLDNNNVSSLYHLALKMHSTDVETLHSVSYGKEDIYEMVLAKEPNHAPALNGLGAISSDVSLLLASLSANPKCWKPYYNIACFIEESVEIAGVECSKIDLLVRAAEINENETRILTNLGKALPLGGKVTINGVLLSQVELYQKAIQLNPKDSYAHFNLGCVLPEGSTVELDGVWMGEADLKQRAFFLDADVRTVSGSISGDTEPCTPESVHLEMRKGEVDGEEKEGTAGGGRDRGESAGTISRVKSGASVSFLDPRRL